MLTRDYIVLPATHTFIHEWNEPSCLYIPAAVHHRKFGRHSLFVPQRAEGWVLFVSWPWPLTFWSQNKWVSRTHGGTSLSRFVICLGFWDTVRKNQTDTQAPVKPTLPPRLPSAWVIIHCNEIPANIDASFIALIVPLGMRCAICYIILYTSCWPRPVRHITYCHWIVAAVRKYSVDILCDMPKKLRTASKSVSKKKKRFNVRAISDIS